MESVLNLHLILDGVEGRSYKPLHKVRLLRDVFGLKGIVWYFKPSNVTIDGIRNYHKLVARWSSG